MDEKKSSKQQTERGQEEGPVWLELDGERHWECPYIGKWVWLGERHTDGKAPRGGHLAAIVHEFPARRLNKVYAA